MSCCGATAPTGSAGSSIALQSPSWVEPHPRLPVLYVAQETAPGEIVVLGVEPDGSLRERQRADSHGEFPCHLAVDGAGKRLVVSNYEDGAVANGRWRPTGRSRSRAASGS